MRTGWAIGLALVPVWTAGCSVDRPPKKQGIKENLRLEFRLVGPRKVEPGEPIPLEMTLVNRSRRETYRVVKPGDGSEMGWREPHVFFTATMDRGDGKWRPVPEGDYGCCGMFDGDWPKSAVELGPGKKLPLNDWIPSPDQMLEFQESGRVRLRVHYAYRAGAGTRSPKEPKDLGILKGVPAFEIVSEPVEFEVVRPLEVLIRCKKPLKVNTVTRISDLLEVVLVNRSKEKIEVSSPTLNADARLRLEITGRFGGYCPDLSEQRTEDGINKTLKPGEKVALLGKGEFSNDLDGTWEYPVEDKVRVRAVYSRSTEEDGSEVKSRWVEIPVKK